MIYLARHGKTVYNERKMLNGQFDDPLIPEGEEQARVLARKCESLSIARIYSSPLVRAFVTARIIADHLGLKKIVVMNDLKERDFGVMTHKFECAIQKLPESAIFRANSNSIYFLNGEGVESFPKLIERARPVLTGISIESRNGNALIVSHGDVMKAIEAINRKVPFMEVLKEGHYNNCQIVRL